MKVFYYTVKKPQEKVAILIQTVTRHFHKNEKIQIVAPDAKSLVFISDLFWKEPKESFLPHSVSSLTPFCDKVLICLPTEIQEDFPFLFNVSSEAIPFKAKIIYELEDKTHPSKAKTFEAKFSFYQNLGINITHIS
jgi:DNA polymerase-3 subunit chi